MTSSPDSKTILVADDCAPVGELIELLLCRVGYRVLRATSGADALRLARKTRIDLLLSNLDMPKMRGDELAVRFAAIHPAAPVVFLSSFDHPDEVSEPLDVRMANGPGRVFDGQATTSRMAGGVASSRMASVMGQGLKPLTIR